MPDVDAITQRLRSWGPVECPWTFENVAVVRLADAEAAVLAAVDARTAEIVEWMRGDEAEAVRTKAIDDGIPPEDALAHAVESRFPNGGTNDGE